MTGVTSGPIAAICALTAAMCAGTFAMETIKRHAAIGVIFAKTSAICTKIATTCALIVATSATIAAMCVTISESNARLGGGKTAAARFAAAVFGYDDRARKPHGLADRFFNPFQIFCAAILHRNHDTFRQVV